ncbi:MAG: thiamine diphosphokinase [Treponema sp.]|nr:thiamine diphosphokinase [Treponema sp.]
MRGIAFIGGAGPGSEQCGSLIAGADIIVAADSGLIAAEEAGIQPDWILGDMDSLDDLGRLAQYPLGRVIRYPTDKDYTDTELALRFLWEKGVDETWLVGGGGGRTDHLFAIRSLFERERCPDRWLTAAEDIRCLTMEQELVCTLPSNSLVSVFPLGLGPWKAESRGLKWPLEGLPWDQGFFGISNRVVEGAFAIYAHEGRFLVILPLAQSLPRTCADTN